MRKRGNMAKKNIGLSKQDNLGMAMSLLAKEGEDKTGEKKPTKRRRLKKDLSFKESLKDLLALEAPKEALAEPLKQTPLGEVINYREAILLAQIIKAYNGDTQAAVFVRDSSGNKLKDSEKEEKKKKFEDF